MTGNHRDTEEMVDLYLTRQGNENNGKSMRGQTERESIILGSGNVELESYRTNKGDIVIRRELIWEHGLISIGDFDEEESTGGFMGQSEGNTGLQHRL